MRHRSCDKEGIEHRSVWRARMFRAGSIRCDRGGAHVKNRLAMILTSDVTGLIARDAPVTLANISRGGCLLESTLGVPVGTIALLRLEIRGRLYTDAIRVTRCAVVPGAGERHHVGVAFLQLTVPGPRSLRLYAAHATKPDGGAWTLQFESN
jgi:hypothetical protein